MSDDGKVVSFRSLAPSARLKKFDHTDIRANCQHDRIQVWVKEPIIECADCGSVVDPYYWIRRRCSDWQRLHDGVTFQISEAKAELDELRAALKILRGQYRSEAERRRAEHHLMIMPPRRRVSLSDRKEPT